MMQGVPPTRQGFAALVNSSSWSGAEQCHSYLVRCSLRCLRLTSASMRRRRRRRQGLKKLRISDMEQCFHDSVSSGAGFRARCKLRAGRALRLYFNTSSRSGEELYHSGVVRLHLTNFHTTSARMRRRRRRRQGFADLRHGAVPLLRYFRCSLRRLKHPVQRAPSRQDVEHIMNLVTGGALSF